MMYPEDTGWNMQAELLQFRQTVQERDQLVQKLAAELVNVNEHNRRLRAEFDSRQDKPAIDLDHHQAIIMQKQFLEAQNGQLEIQLKAVREEAALREVELRALTTKMQTLSEANRQLEHHLESVPQLYHRKFQERLAPVTEQVRSIQGENRRLQQEVEGLAHKLLAVQEVIDQPLLLVNPDRPLRFDKALQAPIDDLQPILRDFN